MENEKKKKKVYIFFAVAGTNEKKITKKKKIGAERIWATTQLYCEKKNCIARLRLYCKRRV